jgi:hypothetical protein
MVTEVRSGERERVIHGFRLCVARRPTEQEVEQLLRLYQVSLQKYRKDAGAARAMAHAGWPEAAKDQDLAEPAAWTVIANVLLNLDETITKG